MVIGFNINIASRRASKRPLNTGRKTEYDQTD
jgi:hypothetical protein